MTMLDQLTDFALRGISCEEWASRLTPDEVDALHLWMSNGRVVNDQLMGRVRMALCPKRVEQVDTLNRLAHIVEPGSELWRGQLIPATQRVWRERTYLCTSRSRDVAHRFARSAHGYRYVDDPDWRPQTMLRIVAGENLLGVPHYAATADTGGEHEVVLLPSRLEIIDSDDQVVTVLASRSNPPVLLAT